MANSAVPRMELKRCTVMLKTSAGQMAHWALEDLESESRCLGRCENGPVAVVYPDNVWYQYIDEEDIDEIFESHMEGDEIVNRLLIK